MYLEKQLYLDWGTSRESHKGQGELGGRRRGEGGREGGVIYTDFEAGVRSL